MTRAGQLLREKWAMERAAERLCACGHRMGCHFELPDVLVYDQENPANTRFARHPEHVVGEFHCNVDDCDCVVRR